MSPVLIIAFFSFHKSPSLESKIKKIEFEKEAIYLIQRGTSGKLGNVAKDFNINNKYASHLGIGYFENHVLTVYHVYVEKNSSGNSLYIEPIKNFISPKDLNYLSIWRLKNIDLQKFDGIRNTLIQSGKENINFDFNFAADSKAYYCSEYVVKELQKNHVEIMSDHKKNITGMIRQILKKDTLTYFPVDGFENNDQAIKVFEWIK
ncbi:YiiX/YebB-like N1pC/P60 family cysteine hydrolase [Chryseobacterium sp. T16E-39]|uniref:YiiX/YebB-like N1pC/P60 family cysteine hydrolase n=1 Tax=Chryseobacterium sp. T16E-39 TaxID=2015076 RepID=UPI0012F89169|nr:YiiX/YebB-like N1pC/P60 family cysteine hydrolase [Chryseobacterium sp. T16E-39]